MIPDWWEALLLALAAWRSFQLIGADDILDRPRRYVTRLGKEWQKEGDPVPSDYRISLNAFITCPYCAGFWIAAVWWGVWAAWPDALIGAVPLAFSAAVVGADKLLGSE